MNWLKHIAMLMLSLSIAVAGLPAQAQQQCPMVAKMQMQQMDMKDMKDCKGCIKATKQEQKKNGCCDDSGCNAKCSAMSGSITMNLPTVKVEFAAISSQAPPLYSADATVASAHLNSQERPPKYLS